MRKVRGILIDPFACTVQEVEHDAKNYRNIYKLISHEVHPVECFTCVYSDLLQPGEAIFVDDNGLLNKPVRFFGLAGYGQGLAGKGLLLGSDAEGNTIGASSLLSTIKALIMFVKWDGERLVQTNEPWNKEDPWQKAEVRLW